MLVALVFFYQVPPSTEIYTLSLHDALPIWPASGSRSTRRASGSMISSATPRSSASPSSTSEPDRKSTRLNSSHPSISYAVFCLKKKKAVSSPYGERRVVPDHGHVN